MTVIGEAVPFSELIQHPRETTGRLERAVALRLVRRNQPDLLLVQADRAERDAEILDLTTRLLAGLIARTSDPAILRDSVVDVFAWTRFLPEEAVTEFLAELAGVARAAAEIRNLRPVAQVITEWQHTAEVYADPELHRVLTREYTSGDDLGPVPEPGGGA